jgi:hypothetical protein
MKYSLFLLFTLQISLLSSALFAQSTKITLGKAPSWVTNNTIDYNKNSLDKEAIDGYIHISSDIQISLSNQSKFFRFCKKIISQSGVQNGSEISIPFDPIYEQLTFHSVRIIRDGESLNRLQLSNIKTIHQEKELKSFIYNGSLDAVLILEDVRQGDVIEYSYTIKGFNPIFKNKFSGTFDLEYSSPIYDLYCKLLVPQGRKMNIKSLNQTIQPVVSIVNGEQVYEWHKTNIPPLHLQDYTPSWYNPYEEVLVSEFNSWKEVNDWALELFPVKTELSDALQKKIAAIKAANSSDSDKVKAALRFVQDDIRYMGFEMGENSHRPAPPSKVFAQRFGDCKEKSYLFCCMLNAMNIESCPVLINTAAKKSIGALLPAPTDFDHATVRVKLDNDYFWFDPTISYQRGSIKKIFFPDYQAGLVVSGSTSELTPITFRNTSSINVTEYFKVADMLGSGTLKVTSAYRGTQADNIRADFNTTSIRELMNSYQKFYAGYYEDIKADSLTYTDDDSSGAFNTIEYYTLPDFWNADKKQNKKFSLASFIINDIIRKPKEKIRKMPFSLSYPAQYKEEVIIDLPENWKVTESESHLKNGGFEYNHKFYCVNKQVFLETNYASNKDHASVDEAPSYFNDLNEYDESASFELTYGDTNTSNTAASASSNKNIFFLIILVVLIGAVVWWSKLK